MSRGRKPTPPEDRALWEHVKRSVSPLRPLPKVPVTPEEEPEPAPKKAPPKKHAVAHQPVTATTKPAPGRPPALSPIDRRTMSRLNRGALSIDARIDLHGMTQVAAHAQLVGFLRGAQSSGARLVLVITGKGRTGGLDERGVLRRAVPIWLASTELRPIVVGFDEAGRSHGGAGALYVRLRRSRTGD